MKKMPNSPECERLWDVAPYSQKIGEFVDWIRETYGARFAIPHTHGANCFNEDGERICDLRKDDLSPFYADLPALLAEFFDINMERVEDERRNILEQIRQNQAQEIQH